MKFCSKCGGPVIYQVPEGDNRERAVCTVCHHIHYENPRIISGCIPYWEDRVLLCRRAIHPQYGLWTIPAGFMEKGESLEHGALRETHEEAWAQVELGALFVVYSVVHINQVQMFFLARLKTEDGFEPGIETLETRLFHKDEIPWDEIAFSAVRFALEKWVEVGADPVLPPFMKTFQKTPDGY